MSRLLIPVLLCGVCVCACTAQQRGYGVKLCGREFIRAVIFTCGGSRWRRSIDPQLPAQDENLLLSYQSSAGRGDQPGWLKSNEPAAAEQSSFLSPSSSSSSLGDLLQVMGAQMNTRDESTPLEDAQRSWMDSPFSSGPPGGERFRSLDLIWPRQDRRRRNFSLGLAGLCCNQGCTKNDIGRLC